MDLRVCALIIAVYAVQVSSTPIIFRSGVGKLEDHGGGESGRVYAGHANSGLSNFDIGSGFNKDNQRIFESAADAGKFGQADHKKLEKTDQGAFGGQKFHKIGGGAVTDFDQKSGHKKGHQSSGFHNTYKKDESGSKSSFFDGANDQGGRYNHATKENSLGNVGARRANGHYLTENSYNKDKTQKGGYANGGRNEQGHADRRNFNRERFYDDRKQAGRNNAASRYGAGGRQLVETVHSPPYFQPYLAPVGPIRYTQQHFPHKAAVYEDPRIIDNEKFRDYDRFYDDYLDAKPPNSYSY